MDPTPLHENPRVAADCPHWATAAAGTAQQDRGGAGNAARLDPPRRAQ